MNILVVALHKNSQLMPVSFELLNAAQQLGGDIATAILAADAPALAAHLAAKGGGKVLAVSNPALQHFNDEVYAKALTELVGRHTPHLVLGPANSYGKALFARLAAMVGGTMISDITGITVEGGRVTVSRPCYGGSVIATHSAKEGAKPFFVTVRPKIFAESSNGAGNVVAENVAAACFDSGTTVKEVKSESSGTRNLAEADRIVSAGRGVRGPENIPMVRELADALGAAFGASRAVVDAGWTEYPTQVGQTGRTVNPKLYVAVGISGAIQHLVGMRSSQQIVAINKDKDAPIFNVANYGIVGDLFEIVPALTKKFRAELG
ncbi:MAG: electron transfer flavoprotein subunit alpha/FixB family protein [Candidatus Zixiibacteriota bacterium]